MTGALLVFAGILAACAGHSPIAALPPAPQQDLTVAEGPDFQQADPPDEADVGLAPTVRMLEGLVWMDAGFHLRPSLATSWEFFPPRTWRFHLRRGVHFHDGRLFTADAVKWSVERWMRGGRLNYLALGPGAQVTIRDSYTVDIGTVVPNRRLVEALADQRRAIVAPGTYPGDGRTPGSTPDGTGPFEFVRYFPQRELVLAGFKDYWGGAPRISRLTIRYEPDPGARYDALRQGRAAVAVDLAPEQARDLVSSAGLKLEQSAVAGADLLFFNLQRPAQHPLVQDPAVRRAVSLAIDRDAIVEQSWNRLALPLRGLTIPALARGQAPALSGSNLDQARRLLDAAGWLLGPEGIRMRDGRALRLKIVLGDLSEQRVTAGLLQSDLLRAGIAAEISQPDEDTFFNRVLGGGDYDLAGLGFIGQRDANPLGMLSYLSPAPGGCNFCIFANLGPAFDERFAHAVAAEDGTVSREAAALSKTALIDEAAVIILAGKPRLYGLSRAVQDFVAAPKDPLYDRAWLAAG